MRDQPCETCSSKCSRRAADAHNGADAGGWKHVGWRGEEIRGPALVSGGGEAEEANGRPCIVGEESVHVRNEHDGKHADGADRKSELAPGVDAVAVFHAEAGEPATGDGADA